MLELPNKPNLKIRTVAEFMEISNGGYFVEWACGADLSVDTIEAKWKVTGSITDKVLA